MSYPETPLTRQEMYLDAIARGETDGLPAVPNTRLEMYLDYIARNGGGGGGGGEPAQYIKSAAVSGNKLTLTKKDGSKVEFDMTSVVNTINASITALETAVDALETEVDGKQDTISDLSTIRDNAGNGMLAYNRLNADVSYIELTAEDSETHDTTTFKIFGYEVDEGGGV